MTPERFLEHVRNLEPNLVEQVDGAHALMCSQGACNDINKALGIETPNLPSTGRGRSR